MKKYNIFLIILLCSFISACSNNDVVLGNVNPDKQNTFVRVSSNGEDIVITKINGLLTNANPKINQLKSLNTNLLANPNTNLLTSPTKFLVRPGKNVIEAYFAGHKNLKVRKCFNLKAGKHYQLRRNISRNSNVLITSEVNGIVYGTEASRC